MSDESPISRSFARQLEEFRSVIDSRWSADSCDAAFAHWAAHVAGLATDLLPLEPVDVVPVRRHGEAPVLARIGYSLALTRTETTQRAFIDGARRLTPRDPYPLDGNTFIYRPVELLGIAAGAFAVRDDAPDLLRWLHDILSDPRRRLTSTHPSLARMQVRIAEHYAGHHSSNSVPTPSTFTDFATLIWLRLSSIDSLSDVVPQIDPQQELLRTAGTALLPNSPAELVIAYLALKHTVEARFGRLELSGRPFVDIIVDMCRRFHTCVAALGRRHANRPTFPIDDEYDVQDLLVALLHLIADDIRPEEWMPSYAGKSSRSDILLKTQQVVVEVKKTRKGLADREVTEQLIIDKAQYRTHPDCRTLLCFVYDPDRRIVNPVAIETDLSGSDGNLATFVVINSG